jgi:hypothetical protein
MNMKRNKETRELHEENDALMKDPITGLTDLEANVALLYVEGGYPVRGNKMNALIMSQYSSQIPCDLNEAIAAHGLKMLTKVAHEIFSIPEMDEFIDSLVMKTGTEDEWIKRKARNLIMKYEDSNPAVAANLIDKVMKSNGLYQAKEVVNSSKEDTVTKLQDIWKKNSELRKNGTATKTS